MADKKICGAGTVKGGICKSTVVMANGRCMKHGGLTPKGAASPHFKHGKRSKYMPASLLARFEQAIDDPELLSLRGDIGIVETFIYGKLEAIGTGNTLDKWFDIGGFLAMALKAFEDEDSVGAQYQVERANEVYTGVLNEARAVSDLLGLIAQRAKLVESERKAQEQAGLTVALQQNMVLMQVLAMGIREIVKDKQTLNALSELLISTFGVPEVHSSSRITIEG